MFPRIISLFLLLCVHFCSFGQVELELISKWDNPDLPGSSQYDNTYNEVWGYVQDGREYAIIGSTMGTHIFDITDGGPLEELFFIKGITYGDHIIHRDYHDYKGYLYAVADEDKATQWGGMQIIDLKGLPNSIEVVYESHKLFRKSHNIFIDTITSKLYALSAKGGKTGYQAMKVFSLENPIDPVEIAHYKSFGDIDIGHVHDAYVHDDLAFLNCGFDGLFIVNFKEEPEQVITRFANSDYPEPGYNHSGWVNEDFTHYYFADETHGSSMKTLDITGMNDIEVVGTFFSGDANLSIPHNQVVHKNFLFVSYYYDGIQVYDISSPATPTVVASYATSTYPVTNKNYEGAWGVFPFFPSGKIIVSDMQNGLFLFDCFDAYCAVLANDHDVELSHNLRAFPNPASNLVRLESSESIDHWKLYDVKGKLLMDGDQANVSTAELSDGLYFLQCLLANGSSETLKIQVIK